MTKDDFQKLVCEQLAEMSRDQRILKQSIDHIAEDLNSLFRQIAQHDEDIRVLKLPHIDKQILDKINIIEAKISILNNRLLNQEALSEISNEPN